MTQVATYTELETKIIETIQRYLNGGQDQIFVHDIECEIDYSTKQIRGALSSLVKKHKIDVNKKDGGLISLFTN